MADKIQFRRDTAARWAEVNPILLSGEIGLVTDSPNKYKLGNGVNNWNDLPLQGFNGTLVDIPGTDSNSAMSQKGATNLVSEYNVSANNSNTEYTFAQAVALVPVSLQKGGLTIKYIDSTTHEYAIKRLMSSTWNTTESNWQGIDDEPTAGSNNLVKSSGIKSEFVKLSLQNAFLTCSTASGTAAKVITAEGFAIPNGGSIKVKFTNENTATTGVTLNINNTGAKPLVYIGAVVSDTNTWDKDEICEIYYDGVAYYANPVECIFNTKYSAVSMTSNITWSDGYIDSNGDVVEATIYKVSNLISIPEGAVKIRYFAATDIGGIHKQLALYDSNDMCIETLWFNQNYGDDPTIIDLPLNAKKFRVSSYIGNGYINALYVSVISPIFVTVKNEFDFQIQNTKTQIDNLASKSLIFPTYEQIDDYETLVAPFTNSKVIVVDGTIKDIASNGYTISSLVDLPSDAVSVLYRGSLTITNQGFMTLCFYDENENYIKSYFIYSQSSIVEYQIPVGAKKVRIALWSTVLNNFNFKIKRHIQPENSSLDSHFKISETREHKTDFDKTTINWTDGYILESDGTPLAKSYGKLSQFIEIPEGTNKLVYRGGVDTTATHPFVAYYDDSVGTTCLGVFRNTGTEYKPSWLYGVTSDIPSGAHYFRFAEYAEYITSDLWGIQFLSPYNPTNLEAYTEDSDKLKRITVPNHWYGKTMAAFGASNTYVGNYPWPDRIADNLGASMRNFARIRGNRRCSNKYENGVMTLAGISATIAEMQALGVSSESSWENTFTSDLDLVIFGEFAGESWDESDVIIDGQHVYGGLELLDILVGPTSSNRHFTYSDNTTLESHRNSQVGAIIYLIDKLLTINPACRIVFESSYVHIQSQLFQALPQQEGIEKVSKKLHIPYIKTWEKLNFTYYNNEVYMKDTEHQSDKGNELIANIVTHELLLIS